VSLLSGRAQIRLEPDSVGPGQEIAEPGVEWTGDDRVRPLVLPAYFDRILFQLADKPAERRALYERCRDFAEATQRQLETTALWDIETPPDHFLVRAGAVQPTTIEVEVEVDQKRQSAAASARYRPRSSQNDTVAELGFWALWEWMLQMAKQQQLILGRTLDLFASQCAYYRQHGFPERGTLGAAPFAPLAMTLLESAVETAAEQQLAKLAAGFGISQEELVRQARRRREPRLLRRIKVGPSQIEAEIYEQGDTTWACDSCLGYKEGGLRIVTSLEWCERCLRGLADRSIEETIAEDREEALRRHADANALKTVFSWRNPILHFKARRDAKELGGNAERWLADMQTQDYREQVALEIEGYCDIVTAIDGLKAG
jgi:hypothetical protein